MGSSPRQLHKESRRACAWLAVGSWRCSRAGERSCVEAEWQTARVMPRVRSPVPARPTRPGGLCLAGRVGHQETPSEARHGTLSRSVHSPDAVEARSTRIISPAVPACVAQPHGPRSPIRPRVGRRVWQGVRHGPPSCGTPPASSPRLGRCVNPAPGRQIARRRRPHEVAEAPRARMVPVGSSSRVAP